MLSILIKNSTESTKERLSTDDINALYFVEIRVSL